MGLKNAEFQCKQRVPTQLKIRGNKKGILGRLYLVKGQQQITVGGERAVE